MAFALGQWSLGGTDWIGADSTPDGRWVGVRVRAPRTGRGLPVVLKCAQSSGIAMGEHAIAELEKELGSAPWTYPLARGDYQMLVVPEPPTLESEIESSLRWTLSSMVDFPIDQCIVQWMRIPTAEFDVEHEKQLYVIVARDQTVEEQAAPFRVAKAPLKAVEVRETALRNVAALLEKKDEGIGLVTLGATGVTTTFTFRGELYLDRFIAQPLEEVLDDEPAKQLRFMDRIATQVYQSMDLLGRNFPFINVGRIVVGAAPGLDIASHLRGKLPVPVDALDLSQVLNLDAVPELRKPEMQSRYVVAIGAALRGNKGAA